MTQLGTTGGFSTEKLELEMLACVLIPLVEYMKNAMYTSGFIDSDEVWLGFSFHLRFTYQEHRFPCGTQSNSEL